MELVTLCLHSISKIKENALLLKNDTSSSKCRRCVEIYVYIKYLFYTLIL